MNVFGIVLGSSDLWLLAVVGAGLALLIPHRLQLWRERNTRLLVAKGKFRDAFNIDIGEVSNSARLPSIYVYLAQRFPKHCAAVNELAAHLGPLRRRRLCRDWQAYAGDTNDIRNRYADESSYASETAGRKLAVDRLKKVVAHGIEI